ncbi:MAG: TlpA family protein disulfide reductase, partial [Gammaproteobacteria bacterium]|nr:TlpA family protein disulfide reductase [Gammaproteobacteria bacterium]
MEQTLDEFEFFLEKDWSDGFPVVTPTEERLRRTLAATQRDPDEVIGPIPPAGEIATVRSVAVHAVMAGCKPEYFPVVLGGIKLILREELNM